MSTVHIHARDIVLNDAVGSFARQIAILAEKAGHDVRLWAEHTDVQEPHPVETRSAFWTAVQPQDVIFFNHSIFDPALDDIVALSNAKIVYFHNITPPDLIDRADERTIENCRLGLEQRPLLAKFDIIMVNSEATAKCLLEAFDADALARHKDRIVICPPLIGADRWNAVQAEDLRAASDKLNLLYVGRIVAHKGVLDIVDIAGELAALKIPIALDIVGGPANGPYVDLVKARAKAIEENDGVPVTFHHGISDRQLKALYEMTTACIAHSSHEGFCVPALDALAFDRPMFVTPVAAILEVLGPAALLIPQDDKAAAAAAIAAFLMDGDHAGHASVRKKRFEELRTEADGGLVLAAIEGLGAA
ncbi:putative glycosyltransferase [Rhizobium rhizogenes NBRC 13257]|uniref:Glycosyltransferase n=1 Tax=Rhizobium rhizogenes NBRC 13257 TaxID=1220581 RepID=A0AA87QEE1_RHIRH|nr:putative glycosyltransferase [Rhizobium rhizogenes NBRC 13257]